MKSRRGTRSRLLLLSVMPLIALLFGWDSARSEGASNPLMQTPPTVVVWSGEGGTHRWSDPPNWIGGVPRAIDTVRFPTDSPSDAVVDPAFPGMVAGLVLDAGFPGTVTLARDLTVTGDLQIASGTLAGGPAALKIAGQARVLGGLLDTPSNLMTVTSLEIEAPGAVRLGAHGKLDLTGDGTPLSGDGLLDTTTLCAKQRRVYRSRIG